jgi:hypothetical protein
MSKEKEEQSLKELVRILRRIDFNTAEILTLLRNDGKLSFWKIMERIAIAVGISGAYSLLIEIIQQLGGK